MKPVNKPSPVPSILMTAILVLFAAGSAWSVLQGPEAESSSQVLKATVENSVSVGNESPALPLQDAATQVVVESPAEPAEEAAQTSDAPKVIAADYQEASAKAEPVEPLELPKPDQPPAARKQVEPVSPPAKITAATPDTAVRPLEKPKATKPEAPAAVPQAKPTPAPAPRAAPTPAVAPPQPRVEPQSSMNLSLPPPPPTVAEPRREEPKPITAVAPEKEPTREVRAASALPLVKPQVKPQVIAANAERAWVKLNEQQTIIVPKGASVPGLGTFNGTVNGVAQFN